MLLLSSLFRLTASPPPHPHPIAAAAVATAAGQLAMGAWQLTRILLAVLTIDASTSQIDQGKRAF